MKTLAIFINLFFCVLFTHANFTYSSSLDTVNVEVISDEACPGAIINFGIINKSTTPLDSIWWKGDYDSILNRYNWDRKGLASNIVISNPKWIFFTNAGVGKFPFTVTVKNVLGYYKTYYDTVETGEPLINILNDPAICCNMNDTIYADVRFLTKPYNTLQWVDNASANTSPVLLQNKDKFPISLLAGRSSIDLKLIIEDSKGCRGSVSKYFNLTTNVDLVKINAIKISPNPTYQSILIDGLSYEVENSAMIYSIQGQLLKSIPTIEKNEIDLSEFDSGVYLIKINGFAHRVVKM